MQLWIWFFGIAGMAMMGCGRDVAPTPSALPPSPAVERVSPVIPAPEVRAEIIPMESIGVYAVDLHWTALETPSEFWVQRSSGNRKEVIARIESGASFRDLDVSSGKHYSYSVTARDGDGNWELGTMEVEIPVDWVISKNERGPRASNEKPGRLVLEKGAIWNLEGADLDLSLFELISEGGRIETSGRIQIRMQRGKGALELASIGRAGEDGAEGGAGPGGAAGADGRPARYEFDHNGLLFRRRLEANPDPSVYWKLIEAEVLPTAGGPGLVGSVGADGTPGGDSGGVYLEIANPGPFTPTVISAGGPGGRGGRGGMGGAGGPAGTWIGLEAVPKGSPSLGKLYVSASVGIPGVSGAEGNAGPDGKAGPVCVKIAGYVVQGCL